MKRGLITDLGKYKRVAEPGLTILIPFIQKLSIINITEIMVEIDQE